MAVTVAVEKLEECTVSLPKSQIEIRNVPDGYTAEFLTSMDVTVQVRALRNSLESMDTSVWKAYVDLAEYRKEETVNVPIVMELPDGYELMEEPVAVIKLEKDQAE